MRGAVEQVANIVNICVALSLNFAVFILIAFVGWRGVSALHRQTVDHGRVVDLRLDLLTKKIVEMQKQ